MYFFTSDEHYGHDKVREYTHRPFFTWQEMDEELIRRHNSKVKKGDTVIHAGDFTLRGKVFAEDIIKELNGTHIFLQGSHDYWLKKINALQIWERKLNDIYVVVCHYAMRTWPRSHYGSWQLYGHSHGNLKPFENQYDIGVDNNNYYPVSLNELRKLIKGETIYEN